MKEREECVVRNFGPAMVISVERAIYHVLLWDGTPLYTDAGTLTEFPWKPGIAPDTFVPDYDVEGVDEIVGLSVDLDIEPPRRPKSKLFPLFMRLEAEDREKASTGDQAPKAGAAQTRATPADE